MPTEVHLVSESEITNVEQDREHYKHVFSAEKGGYGPAINWYRANLLNINAEDEQSMDYFLYTQCLSLFFLFLS